VAETSNVTRVTQAALPDIIFSPVIMDRRHFFSSAMAGLLAGKFIPPYGQQWAAHRALFDPSLDRRKHYLEILNSLLSPTKTSAGQRMNVHGDKSWEDWQKRTGELPPDFETMPSSALLPDPLVMLDGKGEITSVAQWECQRKLIRDRFEHWIVGGMPPAPTNMRATMLESHIEGDATVRRVVLTFGPGNRGSLHLQLLIPAGKGPFPVLLTNHQRGRPWVNTAMRRGYMGCIYNALDPYYGAPDDSEPWLDLYPESEFSTMGRWAWAAMRAVDHLVTLPIVDRARIAIGGHSRNSKQALIAAALDQRIGAVVSSRGNTGDFMPWRYTEDMFVSESIEELTQNPDWFHPRLRFFVGREDKLPLDQNMVLALVAPRGLLLSHAYQEHQGNAMGVEQSYRSVRRVYRFLGHEQNVGLYQQPGEHPSSAEDIERYFDFFDSVFGRNPYAKPEIWVHGYDYGEWLSRARSHGERVLPLQFPVRTTGDFLASRDGHSLTAAGWPARRKEIQARMKWIMGEEPPAIPYPAGPSSTRKLTSSGWRGQLFSRPGDGYDQAGAFPFGDDLEGFLYRPGPGPESDKKGTQNWPVVIWLHPYSYATGFSRYVYWGPHYQRGFAVLVFDQIGFGARADNGIRFYERHPRWSLLGKMVADTMAAVSAIVDNSGEFDPSRIYLQGYGLGAKVALLTAALDDRVAGVSVSCGFTPLRLARPENGTEGIRHYSHLHGLLPRVGAFIGNEKRLPVDYDEIVAAIAPRPLQIIAPTMDRHAVVDDVRTAVRSARGAYSLLGRPESLELATPEDFNRYTNIWMPQTDWVTRQAGLKVPDAPKG